MVSQVIGVPQNHPIITIEGNKPSMFFHFSIFRTIYGNKPSILGTPMAGESTRQHQNYPPSTGAPAWTAPQPSLPWLDPWPGDTVAGQKEKTDFSAVYTNDFQLFPEFSWILYGDQWFPPGDQWFPAVSITFLWSHTFPAPNQNSVRYSWFYRRKCLYGSPFSYFLSTLQNSGLDVLSSMRFWVCNVQRSAWLWFLLLFGSSWSNMNTSHLVGGWTNPSDWWLIVVNKNG